MVTNIDSKRRSSGSDPRFTKAAVCRIFPNTQPHEIWAIDVHAQRNQHGQLELDEYGRPAGRVIINRNPEWTCSIARFIEDFVYSRYQRAQDYRSVRLPEVKDVVARWGCGPVQPGIDPAFIFNRQNDADDHTFERRYDLMLLPSFIWCSCADAQSQLDRWPGSLCKHAINVWLTHTPDNLPRSTDELKRLFTNHRQVLLDFYGEQVRYRQQQHPGYQPPVFHSEGLMLPMRHVVIGSRQQPIKPEQN